MAEYTDREHYIPLRQSDLVTLLCRQPDLDPAESAQLRQLAELLSATFHFEYHKLLEELKDVYAPFDPDTVVKPLDPVDDADRPARLDALYERFAFLMERANFTHLPRDILTESTQHTSDWGLPMDIDFDIFEKLEVFVRGETVGDRYRRRWHRLWKRDHVRLPLYQRLVVFAKVRPNTRLPAEVNTTSVFLKVFKDIPKDDLEMLFPGARIRTPSMHRVKLSGSLLGSGAWVSYSISQQLLTAAVLRADLLLGPLAAVLGYAYKQYFGYQHTRNAFHLRLAQSLYYQTLGNNAGVLFHLLDEAEEQECREALLGYHALWRRAGPSGWTAAELDDEIEAELERLTQLKVDFEIDDALAKLERLRLVTKTGDRYVAVPIEQALESLDYEWDNFFKYNTAATPKLDPPKLDSPGGKRISA